MLLFLSFRRREPVGRPERDRHIFINAPLGDSNFQWKSVDKCVLAARSVYSLFGAEERLVSRHPDAEHNFPEDMRLEAYRMIDSVLLPKN